MMLRRELLLTLTRPPGCARTDALSPPETFSLIEATSNACRLRRCLSVDDDETRCRAHAQAKENLKRRASVHATNNARRGEGLTESGAAAGIEFAGPVWTRFRRR